MAKSVIDFPSNLNEPDAIVAALALRVIEKIEEKDPYLAELIQSAAIPHRFDVNILEALQSESERKLDSTEVLEQIKRFSFVNEVNPGVFSFHEEIRRVFLQSWRSADKKKKYIKYSNTLRNYFGEKADTNEMLYHWFAVDPDSAFMESQNRDNTLLHRYDTVDSEILIRLAQEQRWAFTLIQGAQIDLSQAALDQLLFKWQSAVESYKKILSEPTYPREIHGRALLGLGYCLQHMGNWAEARDFLEEASAILKQLDDPLLVDVYLNLGWSYSRLGQEAKAIPLLQDALSIAQTLGDLSAQSWALNNLGTIYFGMKDLEEAIAYHQQALNIRCEIDPDGLLVGRSLQNLASICLGVENWKSALSYAKKALSIQQRVEDQFGLSYTLRILATYYEKKANRNRALELLEQSLLIRRNLGAKKEVADTLLDMADIYHKENMPEKAAACLKEVAAIESELDQQGDEND